MSGRILQLAEIISSQTALINEYLSAHNLPHPSFQPDAGLDVVPPSLEAARSAVIDAAGELQDLLLGPTDLIHRLESNHLVSLHAIHRFKIAKTFPVGAEASYDDIAAGCGLPVNDTRRMIRHAITKRIFDEPRKGVVVHTAASRLLAEDDSINDWVGTQCEDILPAAVHVVDAMQKWPASEEPRHTGFALANDTEHPIFMELAKSPSRSRRFGSAMAAYANAKGMEPTYLLDSYDWAANSLVVDVGGARGNVSNMLALHYPQLQLVVQDLPSVVEATPSDNRLEHHVQFMPHNFFDEQPVKDADVYLLRLILHNWPDKYCIQILRALIPALKKNARVLVQDYCLPEPKTTPFWKEKALRSMDLTMLQLLNAREREAQEWVALFQQADDRYELINNVKPEGSSLSLLEFQWKGSEEMSASMQD